MFPQTASEGGRCASMLSVLRARASRHDVIARAWRGEINMNNGRFTYSPFQIAAFKGGINAEQAFIPPVSSLMCSNIELCGVHR